MRDLLKQRRWLGFSAFALGVLVLCIVLANWQYNRYQERLAANDRLDAALSAPPVPVQELIAADTATGPAGAALPAEFEWRTVTATGTFDTAGERAVRRRPLEGRNGFWIVTPLVTDAGTVLVNRGWAPAGADATAAPAVPQAPSGTVTVIGRLRPAEQTEVSDEPPLGQAWSVDPAILVVPGSEPRFNAYIDLRTSEPSAADQLTALADPGHRGLNNLVYAVQWLIFGLVALLGSWRLISAESRRSEGDADAADDPQVARSQESST